jgi:hypothetical protein
VQATSDQLECGTAVVPFDGPINRGVGAVHRVRRPRRALLVLACLFLAPASIHAAEVRLAWDPSPDPMVVGYMVYYGTAPGIYGHSVDVGNATSHLVTGLPVGVNHYFIVRAYTESRQLSDPSNEVGSLTGFTDNPLIAGVHSIRLVHLTELQERVNVLRARFGLPSAAWSDTAVAGVTMIRAYHVAEVRAALDAVYARLERAQPAYTDPDITAGATRIKAAHITELRAAILALE